MVGASKETGDFQRSTTLGEGRYFKNLKIVKLSDAVVGVLIQQVIQDGAGLGRVPIPEVLPLPPGTLGAFPPGPEGSVPRNVDEKIERVGIRLIRGLDQGGEVNAAFRESLEDRCSVFRVHPLGPKFSGGGAKPAHLLGRVVRVLDDLMLLP